MAHKKGETYLHPKRLQPLAHPPIAALFRDIIKGTPVIAALFRDIIKGTPVIQVLYILQAHKCQ